MSARDRAYLERDQQGLPRTVSDPQVLEAAAQLLAPAAYLSRHPERAASLQLAA
jgi:hypothetical protein